MSRQSRKARRRAADAALPLTPEEISALFAPFTGTGHLALAVSGGPDSTALMLLAARWRAGLAEAERPRVTVLSVDHGLRPEASAECRMVASWADRCGLSHETLRWTGAKPASGIQAAAREARYALMMDWCRAHGASRLLTAHTLEDQAETVLMRLARGSGIDGLAAMAAETGRGDLTLARPLLEVARARLRATLEAAGHPWIEDPTNDDETFERVRVRKALPELAALGLTPETLARTARRARKAADALDAVAAGTLSQAAVLWDGGFCTLDREALARAEPDIAQRMMQALLVAVGGLAHPPAHDALEGLAEWAGGAEAGARTLAGCRIAPRKGRIVVAREVGRMGAAAVAPARPGETVWDRRFLIRLRGGTGVAEDARIAPLGAEGWARLRQHGDAPSMPAFVAHGLPALWGGQASAPLAVPHLRYLNETAAGTATMEAEFLGGRRLAMLPLRRLAVEGRSGGV